MVYEGPLEKEKLISITEDFKALVDVEFMQKIGDNYWGGARPYGFELYIYSNKDKEGNDYDYLIDSRYNKTYIVDENPDNIDGYKTWTISGAENEGILHKD